MKVRGRKGFDWKSKNLDSIIRVVNEDVVVDEEVGIVVVLVLASD